MLVYAAASGITLAATATTLVSNVRSNANLELYQRAQERWGRLSNLIQTETTEAEQIFYNQPISCSGVNATSIFSLVVPYLSGTAQVASTTTIHYYKLRSGSNAELRRCGPGYLADGRLNFSAAARDSRLATQTDLNLITSSGQSTNENFSFNLVVYAPNGSLVLGRTATAAVGVSGLEAN